MTSRFRGKSFVKSKMNSIDFKISVTSSNATTEQEMGARYVTIVISLGILLVDVTVIQQMLLDKIPPTQRQLEVPLVHAISIMIAHGPTMQNLRERLSHQTQLVLPCEMARLTHVFHRRHPDHHPSVCCRHLMMYYISTNARSRPLREQVGCTNPETSQTNMHILNANHSDLTIFGEVNDVPVKILIDTGAGMTVINSQFWEKLNGKQTLELQPSKYTMGSPFLYVAPTPYIFG